MRMPKMNKLALVTVVGIGLACMTTSAISQQAPVMHKYLSRAVLTAEGIKDLQRQPPTKLKEGIAKFAASVGGKLEAWYFDAANGIGWASDRRGCGQGRCQGGQHATTAATVIVNRQYPKEIET
jgi:hypothetical protein